MYSDNWFWIQVGCAISGFPATLLYLAYFRYREKLRRKNLPPKNMIFYLHLLGIPTGHIWVVMPWLPQPRLGIAEGVSTMFTSGSREMIAGGIGVLLAFVGGYYCFRFVKANFAVTLEDYAAPKKLLCTGVYAQLRHPGVVAMFFFVSGLAMATGALYTLLMLPLFLPMLWATTYIEESEVLLPLFGDQYREYMDSVSGIWCAKTYAGLALFCLAVWLVGADGYDIAIGRMASLMDNVVNLYHSKVVCAWMYKI